MKLRIALLVVLGTTLLLGPSCSGDDPEPTPTPLPVWATATAQALTPIPVPTATFTPLPPTPAPTPAAQLQGLITRPALTKADRTVVLPSPAPGVDLRGPDPEAHRNETVLYDIANGRRIELGEGTRGVFSPDDTKMVWTTSLPSPTQEGEVWLIDLGTLEKRSMGPGTQPYFLDNETLFARDQSMKDWVINVQTGSRRPWTTADYVPSPPLANVPELRDLTIKPIVDPAANYSVTSMQLVTKSEPARTVLSIDSTYTLTLDDDTLLIAAPPDVLETVDLATNRPSRVLSSLYLYSVSQASLTFVATIEVVRQCWQVVGNARYIVWLNGSPVDWAHELMVYDRRSGRTTELRSSAGPLNPGALSPNGLLAVDGPGLEIGLIDLQTSRYFSILPQPANWTHDMRFASTGAVPGKHGGCLGLR